MQSNTPLWIIGLLLIGFLWLQQQPAPQPVDAQPAVIVVTVVAPTAVSQPQPVVGNSANALTLDRIAEPFPTAPPPQPATTVTPLLADTFATDCEAAKASGRRRSPKCPTGQEVGR